jgi:hypothetical protein
LKADLAIEKKNNIIDLCENKKAKREIRYLIETYGNTTQPKSDLKSNIQT